MKFSLVSAVNNEEILRTSLLSSPDADEFGETILQRGFESAAHAYNAAIDQANNDIMVISHQDVYLPAGWVTRLAATVELLNQTDPKWAILGLYGVTLDGEKRGHLYCVANHGVLGRPLPHPLEVTSLDEVVLILRKSSGLRFDPDLPGFHFYGADLCITARQRNLSAYVVPNFCLHNANEYGMFPKSFWKGFLYMRKKWWKQLPLRTPCIEVQRSLLPPFIYSCRRFLWLKKIRRPLAHRVNDPASLYARLAQNVVP